MLEVEVLFKDDLFLEKILTTKDIPCLCKISKIFEIEFLVINPKVTGIVDNYRVEDIDLRVPAGAGGKYQHYSYSLITISKKTDKLYIIDKLSMFDLWSDGWIPVIEDRKYVDIQQMEEPDWLKDL